MYRVGSATGFLHGLVGGVQARALSTSQTGFAVGPGGGVDVNVRGGIAVRVIQIDFISDHIGGRWGHDLRASVGVVFKVGR